MASKSHPAPRSYGADIAYARHTGNLNNAVYLRRSEWDNQKDKDRAEVEERAWWTAEANARAQEAAKAAGLTNPKELQAAADGKAPLEYLDPVLDEPLSRVMKHGATKYGLRNYRDTPMKMSTYVGAIKRHTLAWQKGEDLDPDSGEHHLVHLAACCAVMLAAIEAGTAVDDRHDKRSTALSDRVHIAGDMNAKGELPDA